MTYTDANGNAITVQLRHDGTPTSASTVSGDMRRELARLERECQVAGLRWVAASVCLAYPVITGYNVGALV